MGQEYGERLGGRGRGGLRGDGRRDDGGRAPLTAFSLPTHVIQRRELMP
jgi:hypothetical protein